VAARRYFILLEAVDGESEVYLRVYLRARICALRGLNEANLTRTSTRLIVERVVEMLDDSTKNGRRTTSVMQTKHSQVA